MSSDSKEAVMFDIQFYFRHRKWRISDFTGVSPFNPFLSYLYIVCSIFSGAGNFVLPMG